MSQNEWTERQRNGGISIIALSLCKPCACALIHYTLTGSGGSINGLLASSSSSSSLLCSSRDATSVCGSSSPASGSAHLRLAGGGDARSSAIIPHARSSFCSADDDTVSFSQGLILDLRASFHHMARGQSPTPYSIVIRSIIRILNVYGPSRAPQYSREICSRKQKLSIEEVEKRGEKIKRKTTISSGTEKPSWPPCSSKDSRPTRSVYNSVCSNGQVATVYI